MAILWLESFDFYGTSISALSLRGYQAVNNAQIISNPAQARTGSGCLRAFGSTITSVVKLLDNTVSVAGTGAGINFLSASGNNRNMPSIGFGIVGDAYRYQICINASLGLTVYDNGVAIGSTSNNLLVFNTYYWIECKIITSPATPTGSIEVRVSGQTVLTINGLVIPLINSVYVGKSAFTGGNAGEARYDDWVIWDNSGTVNNDFLGDRRIVTLYPDADTIDADWTPSTGTSGFAMIDEATPSDSDFITANNVGDISEFEKQVIPLDVNTVAAICPVARAFKDSAGPSTFTIGINSNGNVINSPQFLPNTTVTYFSQIFELNPDGNIPWTRTAMDNATIRLTRVV